MVFWRWSRGHCGTIHFINLPHHPMGSTAARQQHTHFLLPDPIKVGEDVLIPKVKSASRSHQVGNKTSSTFSLLSWSPLEIVTNKKKYSWIPQWDTHKRLGISKLMNLIEIQFRDGNQKFMAWFQKIGPPLMIQMLSWFWQVTFVTPFWVLRVVYLFKYVSYVFCKAPFFCCWLE